MAGSKSTIDRNEIKKWVEARSGWPTTVKSTSSDGELGLLRIDFPGYSGEDSLEEIFWEQFFEKFEESKLAFIYQEETKKGEESRFCKLVSR